MTNVVLSLIDTSVLIDRISEKLIKNAQNAPIEDSQIHSIKNLSVKQFKEEFNISKSSSIDWLKSSTFKSYQIDRKIYFNRMEVEQTIVALNS